ncbi:MAG: ABC transporter ATPase [Flavobacteriales bacterium]|nr:ABC transporter ATPase [Flavobacteriales bacterium]
MTNFNDLSSQSKTWIYTSEREFTSQEIELINNKAKDFIADWESHGKSVKGLIEIRYNRFIFIYADDQSDTLCGRATDSSVRFIQELEQELNISLMDRMLIAYKEENQITTTSLPDFQNLITEQKITENTTVFNCILTQKSELENWEVPAKNSWHKQLIGSV